MPSEYDFVQKSSLKLKGVSDGGVKKKKKKSKKARDDKEAPSTSSGSTEAVANSDSATQYYSSKTKAEIAFIKNKEKLKNERIRQKASESHKERVEKFNNYLNNLSEHYEQSKVSWTK